MNEFLYRILLFEGIAFVLLGIVLLCRRFFMQPMDRIRLTQTGLGLVVVTLFLVFCGLGPKWTIPVTFEKQTVEIAETQISNEPIVESVVFRSETPRQKIVVPEILNLPVMTEPNIVTPVSAPKPVVEYGVTAVSSEKPSEVDPIPAVAVVEQAIPEERFELSREFFVSLGIAAFFVVPFVLLVREVNAWCRLTGITRRSRSASDAIKQLFVQIRGPSRFAVDLWISDEIVTPIVFGFFRTSLLLPEKMEQCGPDSKSLRACLAHECSHLRNGDLATLNIVRLFQYVLWPQPFYWMLRTRLFADQDYLADAQGVLACRALSDYAELLLAFANNHTQSVPNNALGMAEHKSQLRRRIEMLIDNPQPKRNSNKRKLLIPFVLLTLFAVFSTSLQFTETTVGKTESQEQSIIETEMKPISITKNAENEIVVSGILYDKSEEPAPGCTIFFYEDERCETYPPVTSAADGSFVLKAKKIFCMMAQSKDGEDFFLYFLPGNLLGEEPFPVAKLQGGKKLIGRVLDQNGDPVAEATVGMYTEIRRNFFTQSDKQGGFTIRYPNNAPNIISIFAFKSQMGFDYQIYGSEDPAVKLPPGAVDWSQPFTLRLTGAEPITLKVLWDDGTPATGVTVTPWVFEKPDIVKIVQSQRYSDSFNFAYLQYFNRKQVDDTGIVEFDWMPHWLTRITFFYILGTWEGDEILKKISVDFSKDSHEPTVVLYRTKKVSGTVRFPDGQPAEGITVKYDGVNLNLEYKEKSTKTDTLGHYEMDIEAETAYILGVENNDWGAPAYNPLVVNAKTRPEELQNIDFTLQKTVRVHGKAVSGPEKELLRNKRITFALRGKTDEALPKEKQLTRAENHRELCGGDLNYTFYRATHTDAEGNYSIQLGPGEFEIGLTEGYIGTQGLVRDLVPDNTTITVAESVSGEGASGEMLYDIETEASKNGRLRGTVLLADGTPAKHAKLLGAFLRKGEVYQPATPDFTAQTDAEGKFDAPRTLDPVRLRVDSADGKESAFLALDETEDRITVSLESCATVEGRVICGNSGRPLNDVELQYGIQVYGGDNTADIDWDKPFGNPQRFSYPLRFGGMLRTDAEGRFRLENLIPGMDYKITFKPRKEYRNSSNAMYLLVDFMTKPSETISLPEIKLNPQVLEGYEELDASPKFKVTILDEETGKPIPEMKIRKEWFYNDTGKPTEFIWNPENIRGFVGNATTNSSGQAEFDYPRVPFFDRSKVELIIKASPTDESPYLADGTVIPGPFDTMSEATLRLKKCQTVFGKLKSSDGSPLPGAVMNFETRKPPAQEIIEKMTLKSGGRYLWPGEHKSSTTISTADGSFAVHVLPDFTDGYVLINAPSATPVQINLQGLSAAKPEDWIFELPKGTDVFGRVVDTSGNGIAGLWVNFERKTLNGNKLQGNTYALHCDPMGRSVKSDTQGHFVATSLAGEEYAVSVTVQPKCPNVENVELVESFEKPPMSENFVFTHTSVDLRPGEEKGVKLLSSITITGYPTVPLKFVWIDETKTKSALAYSSLGFGGQLPGTQENWSIPVQRTYDQGNRNKIVGTVYVPKGVPFTVSGALVHSVVENGALTISGEKQNWTLEYRFGSQEPWTACKESETTDPEYTYLHAPLEPLESDGATLELRVR